MKNLFETYPSIEIVSDPDPKSCRIRYLKCIKEAGVVRFENKTKDIKSELIEKLARELLNICGEING